MKVVIAGAGIGGLAAGLALSRAGHEVEILERAAEISEVGAGIQISPNGTRILDWLGVSEALSGAWFEPEAITMRMGRSGRQVFRLPMKDTAQSRWGAKFVQIHRADLQEVLRVACVAAGVVIRTSARVTGYVRERGGAAAYLERGTRVFGDLLIGADGLRSVIREQMLGPDRARFTGNVAWRIVVPAASLGDDAPPREGVIWAGHGRHAVTTRVRAGEMVNFVGIVERDDWTQEGWSLTGSRDDLSRDFEGWHRSIRTIIDQTESPHLWALYDRRPLAAWSDGPVVLLGDAAHPMLPSMAQGAVQALEDAAVLTRVLSQAKPDEAAEQYFSIRNPRVTLVQARSAANLRLFHQAGTLRGLMRYSAMWSAGRVAPNLMHRPQDWIYNHDALS